MASRAARLLAEAFRAVGLKATPSKGVVSVAKETVSVGVKINNRAQQEGQHLLAAEFNISLGGAPIASFIAGSVGIDSTAEGARNTAVSEWMAQYGAPIAFALASRMGAAGPPPKKTGVGGLYAKITTGDTTLYHGPLGLRGKAKAPARFSSDPFATQLTNAVVAHLGPKQRFRTATTLLVISGTQVTDGECRINGVVSAGLLADLKKIRWPQGDPKYMYKQFFVAVSPKSTPLP